MWSIRHSLDASPLATIGSQCDSGRAGEQAPKQLSLRSVRLERMIDMKTRQWSPSHIPCSSAAMPSASLSTASARLSLSPRCSSVTAASTLLRARNERPQSQKTPLPGARYIQAPPVTSRVCATST